MNSPSPPAHAQRRGLLVAVGLFLAIALDTSVQLLWKASVPRTGSPTAIISRTFFNPLFQISIVLHIWQFFNWMMVLSNADLSFAQPITALSYVAVTILSAILFGETVTAGNVAGILLILCGVYLISSTPSATVPPRQEEPALEHSA